MNIIVFVFIIISAVISNILMNCNRDWNENYAFPFYWNGNYLQNGHKTEMEIKNMKMK